MRKEYIGFFIVLAIFLALKINSFHYSISDENTYYLMGKTVSEGQFPYKDFFFSHPPFQILMFALLIKIFGFNFFILKASSTIAIAIASFFLFRIASEKIEIKEGLLAASLLLFSYDTLRFSTFPSGVNETAMLIVISFYFLLNGKHITAGIFSGLAGLTGLYSMIPITAFLLYLSWKQRDGFIRFASSFLLVFGSVNILLFIFIPGYINQAYLYHLMKPGEGINKLEILARLLAANFLLWAACALFLISDRKLKKEIFISLLVLIGFLAFFLISKKIFAFYMMLAFPFIALIGAYSIMNTNFGISKKAVFAMAIIGLSISMMFSASRFLSYDYQDFKEAGEIAKYIQENSKNSEEIFGDDSTTPLLSILSGRKIALNFIDSNVLRFSSGITSANDTISDLKGLKFFIVYRVAAKGGYLTYGPASMPEFQKFLERCKEAKVFQSKWQDLEKEYIIYDCSQS